VVRRCSRGPVAAVRRMPSGRGGYTAAMAFIALPVPQPQSGVSSEAHPGMSVDPTPFGLTVEPSAAEVSDLLSSLSAGGILSVALKGRDDLVYIPAASILYFTD
jgi:hypothetical protein